MVHSFLQPTFWTSILYEGVTVYLDYKRTDNSNITITVGACMNQQFNSFCFVAGSSVSSNVTVRIQRGGTFHYA